MTATNHALTGAVIGLTVQNPWLAFPAALLSHVLCDLIPHFGSRSPTWLSQRSFRVYLAVDALLCVALVAILWQSGVAHWLLASLCAFVATSPDLLWIRQFRYALKRKPFVPFWLERFLGVIQWFQRPVGAVVELVWFGGAVVVLWQFL